MRECVKVARGHALKSIALLHGYKSWNAARAALSGNASRIVAIVSQPGSGGRSLMLHMLVDAEAAGIPVVTVTSDLCDFRGDLDISYTPEFLNGKYAPVQDGMIHAMKEAMRILPNGGIIFAEGVAHVINNVDVSILEEKDAYLVYDYFVDGESPDIKTRMIVTNPGRIKVDSWDAFSDRGPLHELSDYLAQARLSEGKCFLFQPGVRVVHTRTMYSKDTGKLFWRDRPWHTLIADRFNASFREGSDNRKAYRRYAESLYDWLYDFYTPISARVIKLIDQGFSEAQAREITKTHKKNIHPMIRKYR